MRTLCAIPLSLFLLFSCSRTAPGAAANPSPDATTAPVREQLASDTPRATPDGATFIAPGGWWIETRGNAIILTPEGDSRIALVDVHAKDADSAVKRAWAALKPNLKWALKLATDAPGREGWDFFRNYQYEVSPNEHRAVGAQASKRGDAFTVVVWDLGRAVAEKRVGQTAAVFDHLQPPGFKRESPAGSKTSQLDTERILASQHLIRNAPAALALP